MKIPFTIDENFGRYRPTAKRFNMTLNRKNLARLDAMACAMDIDAITLTRAAVKWMLASFEAEPDLFLAEAARIKARKAERDTLDAREAAREAARAAVREAVRAVAQLTDSPDTGYSDEEIIEHTINEEQGD